MTLPVRRRCRLLRALALSAGALLPAAGLCAQAAAAGSERPAPVLQSAHADVVRALAFTADGRVLASASWDGTVKLWEPVAGYLLRTILTESRPDAVAISADGRLLAAAGGQRDASVGVWELGSGKLVRALEGHTSCVGALAFGSGGVLASSGDDHTLRLWDVAAGTAKTIELGEEGGRALAFDGPPARVVVATSDSVRVLAPDGTPGTAITTGIERIRSLALVPGSSTLMVAGQVGGGGGEVELWDVRTSRMLKRIGQGAAAVYAAALAPDGKLVASAGQDRVIRLWDVSTGALVRTLEGHGGKFGWVMALAFSPDGELLASGGEDRAVRVWRVRDGALLHSFAERGGGVEAVAFSPDGRTLAAAGSGAAGNLALWDLGSGSPARTIAGRPPDREIRESQEDRQAAANFESGWHLREACGFDVTSMNVNFAEGGSGRVAEVLQEAMAGTAGTVRGIGFSPDGKQIAQATLDRFVKVWNGEDGTLVRDFVAHRGPVRTAQFSPDGTLIASGGADGQVRLWNARTGYLQNQYSASKSATCVAAFSPDGRRLLGANQEKDVTLWDVASGEARRLPVEETVYAAAFSADGKRVALAGSGTGNPLLIFDTDSARQVRKVELPFWAISLVFSDDGSKLFAGGHAGDLATVDAVRGVVSHVERQAHAGPVWALSRAPGRLLFASASADATVRIWSAQSGELLATLLHGGAKGEWLVVTPDGLFDGSPRGWEQLRWRFSDALFDTAPVEAFFAEYYTPGLLADVVASGRPAPARPIARLDRRGASVSMRLRDEVKGEVTRRTVTLELRVAEAPAEEDLPAGGARDLRLFRNGSLVRVWRGDLLEGGGGAATFTAEVPVVAGENAFTAYAFNRDNVKSVDAGLVVRGAPSLARSGTAWVVAIGIDRYSNPDYDLGYAVADASAFADEMKRQQLQLRTFAGVEVVALTDASATRKNLLDAFAILSGRDVSSPTAALAPLRRAQPEDAVFVYFAGHGIARGPRFYLLPHDLGYDGPREEAGGEAMGAILAQAVSDQELEKAFQDVDAGRQLLVIDACHSGQALESEEKRRGPMNSRGLAQLAYEKGLYVLAAAQGYQAALEVSQLGHGLLTYALVEEGLKSGAADAAPRDRRVVMREWLDFAALRVPQLQGAEMEKARQAGRAVEFVEGDKAIAELARRRLQRPRVFYRREEEREPLVVAGTP